MELAGTLRRYRALTVEMARRELTEQYAGQAFGKIWVIVHPLFLIGLYVFVFAVVFKTRIGGTVELPLDYTTYLLSGLIPWLAFQQSMSRACVALTSQSNLVKQVVFPIEVLPAKTVLASLVPQLVGFVVLFAYVIATFGMPPVTYVLIPVLLAFQLLAMMGVAFALAAVGAYLRDAKDFVQLFCMMGVYLLPVVYLPEWVPTLFKPLLYLNPFSYMVWAYQDALYFGRFQHPWAWGVFAAGSVFVFSAGYRLFRSLRPQLENVLVNQPVPTVALGPAIAGEVAISVKQLSKAYPVYARPFDLMLELFTRRVRHTRFWALRDVSFDVLKGEAARRHRPERGREEHLAQDPGGNAREGLRRGPDQRKSLCHPRSSEPAFIRSTPVGRTS